MVAKTLGLGMGTANGLPAMDNAVQDFFICI